MKLFRCGLRRPHGCRMTIGGAYAYPFSSTDSRTGFAWTSNVHVEWSATFHAAGKFFAG